MARCSSTLELQIINISQNFILEQTRLCILMKAIIAAFYLVVVSFILMPTLQKHDSSNITRVLTSMVQFPSDLRRAF